MKLLVFILLSFTSFFSWAQIIDSDIIGKWKIVDIKYKSTSIICVPYSKAKIEREIKENYLNSYVEFFKNKKIVYIDKSSIPHFEKGFTHFSGLQDYNWKLCKNNFLQIIHQKDLTEIKNEIHEKRIHLKFVEFTFILEKSPNHLQLSKPKQ